MTQLADALRGGCVRWRDQGGRREARGDTAAITQTREERGAGPEGWGRGDVFVG